MRFPLLLNRCRGSEGRVRWNMRQARAKPLDVVRRLSSHPKKNHTASFTHVGEQGVQKGVDTILRHLGLPESSAIITVLKLI